MSYYVDLSFKAVETREEAMDFGVRFSRMLAQPEYAKKLIHDNIRYFHGNADSTESLEGWLRGLLTVRLIYWPEHKLAAIIGNAWPEACMSEFALQSHEFQNSCDPDYEFDSWPKDIEFFQQKLAEAEKMSFEGDRNGEYERCCALYEEIIKALDLDAWIHETPNDAFEMMAFSGVYQSFQLHHLVFTARAYLKKWNNGISRLLNDITDGPRLNAPASYEVQT